MPRKSIQPPNVPDSGSRLFSQVLVSGKMVFISAQYPVDKDNKLVGGDDFAAQCDQVYKNFQACLEAAGATWHNVVKMNVYITNRDGGLNASRTTREKYFPKGEPVPAATTVVVQGFSNPNFKIVVDGMAILE